MHHKTLAEISHDLSAGQYSSEEITTHYLTRIKQHNDTLNAFISITEEKALIQAAAADKARAQGLAGPLTGIPLAHKDIFCTKNVKTTCGSKMLHNFIAPYDATVVKNLETAGMVTLGKTNMDEFAMGSSNETSFYGPVKNPWQLDAVPGGSSGGSAAAIAAGLAPAATGTDTGGSIRQPAAFCGITGLKPTYGRISRWGMIAFASSLDQGGPMTRSAEDAALLLNAMASFDPQDSTSIACKAVDFTAQLNAPLKGLRIGVPQEFFTKDLNSDIAEVIQNALKHYETLGATIKSISLPHSALSTPTYYVVAPAECSSNLARYDGVRFGHRCENPKDLMDLYKRSRGEGFGEEVKRRIMVGTYVLSAGYYDAYYVQAQKVRRLIKNDFTKAFENVDVIMGPTAPTTAFLLGEKTANPINMYLSDIYTIATNLAGLPGISIPAGFTDGLPIGLQITGNYFSEAKLLNVAHQFQLATDIHKQFPPIE